MRGFFRYHKYTLGADLRRQAAQVCRWVAQAVRFPEQRLRSLEARIDD